MTMIEVAAGALDTVLLNKLADLQAQGFTQAELVLGVQRFVALLDPEELLRRLNRTTETNEEDR